MSSPEQLARQDIDALLEAAGWHVCDAKQANIHATRGVAIREFQLSAGHGAADYVLYVDGKAIGVIEAKKKGSTLFGVQVQSARYTQGLPSNLPAWQRPLPFAYESTGVETRFTNGLDPAPRARPVFAFHQPGHLAALFELPVTFERSRGPSERQPPARRTPPPVHPEPCLFREPVKDYSISPVYSAAASDAA